MKISQSSEWIYIIYIPLSLMHLNIPLISPTEKKFHAAFFCLYFRWDFFFVQNEMFLQKCLSKQHFPLTAEYIYNVKKKANIVSCDTLVGLMTWQGL